MFENVLDFKIIRTFKIFFTNKMEQAISSNLDTWSDGVLTQVKSFNSKHSK